MNRFAKKIMRLRMEKLRRVTERVKYSSKDYVTLRLFDKARMDYFPKRCHFHDEERKRRGSVMAITRLCPSKQSLFVSSIRVVSGERSKRRLFEDMHYRYTAPKFLSSL